VLAVSPWVRDFAREHGAERVTLAPNGVAPVFEAPVTGAVVRERLGLGDAQVVGYLGSFQDWQDVEGLVDAFARLPGDARLLLVGHGPSRDSAKARTAELGVADRVVDTGHVAPEEVPEHIAAMDVAVAPYRARADFYFSPLKLFEYMATGTATVAARIGQIADVVDDGVTGLLYEPGDTESLVHAISRPLNDRLLARAVGGAGREAILAGHTMAANAERAVALARDQLVAS
jgi:glycosyltransferase involved in cell wall biosynthesis